MRKFQRGQIVDMIHKPDHCARNGYPCQIVGRCEVRDHDDSRGTYTVCFPGRIRCDGQDGCKECGWARESDMIEWKEHI